MKHFSIFKSISIVMLIALGLFLGCKKEIPEKGDKGDPGIAGPAGSIVLSGNGAPASSLGLIGDFYLDLASSNFFGPKKTDGWGTPFSMRGANGQNGATGATGATGAAGVNGANGTPGSKILSGEVTPAADLGALRDYYLDKPTYNLYGPKLASGWGVALSLKGSANVIYSGWNYAKFFRDSTIDNTALRLGDLAAPALTTAMLNNASIQVYLNYGGGVLPLPYSSYAGGRLNTISYLPRLGRFTITRFTADNSNSVALSTLLQYRYIIIPGGTAVSAAHQGEKINLNDYQAVQRKYNMGN